MSSGFTIESEKQAVGEARRQERCRGSRVDLLHEVPGLGDCGVWTGREATGVRRWWVGTRLRPEELPQIAQAEDPAIDKQEE